MNNRIILLTSSMILALVVIIIVLIRKKAKKTKKYPIKGKHHDLGISTDNKIENSILLERIRRLEYEVSKLKEDNDEFIRKNETILKEKDNINTFNFKPVLNYNMFKEKNRDIIHLYNKGMSQEDIAKSLNKSVREIEMVIKLIK